MLQGPSRAGDPVMGVLERLLGAVRRAGLFKRSKVSLEEKVWATMLYLAGLSVRGMTERYSLINAGRGLLGFGFTGLSR